MWTFLIRSATDENQKELIQSAYAYANNLKAEQRELANEVILANRWQKTYEEREALRGLEGVQEGVAALVGVCHGRAREMYAAQGYNAKEGFDFTVSKHPQERAMFALAEIAYDFFRDNETFADGDDSEREN